MLCLVCEETVDRFILKCVHNSKFILYNFHQLGLYNVHIHIYLFGIIDDAGNCIRFCVYFKRIGKMLLRCNENIISFNIDDLALTVWTMESVRFLFFFFFSSSTTETRYSIDLIYQNVLRRRTEIEPKKMITLWIMWMTLNLIIISKTRNYKQIKISNNSEMETTISSKRIYQKLNWIHRRHTFHPQRQCI